MKVASVCRDLSDNNAVSTNVFARCSLTAIRRLQSDRAVDLLRLERFHSRPRQRLRTVSPLSNDGRVDPEDRRPMIMIGRPLRAIAPRVDGKIPRGSSVISSRAVLTDEDTPTISCAGEDIPKTLRRRVEGNSQWRVANTATPIQFKTNMDVVMSLLDRQDSDWLATAGEIGDSVKDDTPVSLRISKQSFPGRPSAVATCLPIPRP